MSAATVDPRERVDVEVGGTIYRVPRAVAAEIELLQDAWEREEGRKHLLASELRWYCDAYDANDLVCIQARESFGHALQLIGQPIPAPPPRNPYQRENRVGMWSFAVGALLGTVAAILVLGWLL